MTTTHTYKIDMEEFKEALRKVIEHISYAGISFNMDSWNHCIFGHLYNILYGGSLADDWHESGAYTNPVHYLYAVFGEQIPEETIAKIALWHKWPDRYMNVALTHFLAKDAVPYGYGSEPDQQRLTALLIEQSPEAKRNAAARIRHYLSTGE